MADSKLSELTSILTPATSDLLYIVDVSDTTDGAGGSSRKITAEALVENLTLTQLTGSGGVLTLPAGADTLVGRATTDTLTNKTLASPVVTGTIDSATTTIQPSTTSSDAILKIESGTAADRADFQLEAHDATNNGDQFLFSLRTDQGDVTISGYDDSATTFHQLLEFEYLTDRILWGANTHIFTGGAYNTASAQNHLVLQHQDSSDVAGTSTTGIIFEFDADAWDGSADKHARIFAERTSSFANSIGLVLSTYSGGALNERLRIDTQITSQVQFNVDTIGEDTAGVGVTVDSLLVKDGTLPNHPFTNMYKQALVNGNFDVWQRGTSASNPSTNTYPAADRWKVAFDADGGTPPTTIAHSRQAITPGDLAGSFYHYRVAPDGAGSGFGTNSYYTLGQYIEHGTRFLNGSGRTVTISFYAKSSISNKKIGVAMDMFYGTGGTPSSAEEIQGGSFTLTSSWVKYTQTFTMSTLTGKTFGTDNNDTLVPFFAFQWGSGIGTTYNFGSAENWVGSGNIDIAQVQICVGSVAVPFQAISYQEELTRCQRYYEAGTFFHIDSIQGAHNLGSWVNFATTKRTIPTVTQTNASATNCSTSTQQASVVADGFLSFRAGTGAGAAQFSETWIAVSEL